MPLASSLQSPVVVTGGCGYIGSVVVEALRARGERVVVIDNLATGHRASLAPEVEFHKLDLKQTTEVSQLFKDCAAGAVMHFAAFSLVGESVTDPQKYIENNVGGTLSLLDAMRRAEVKQLVFSSTAATYGEPTEIPITESHSTIPTNPYGHTKRFMEQAMECYAAAYDLRFVALRYFNAAGAAFGRGEHHDPETHLIPLVLQVALGQRPHIAIFGSDYDTPDGTCVRDYIHVQDLAAAHLAALDHMRGGGAPLICNLGNGHGYSVREVIETCRSVTGHAIPTVEGPRRAGDPSRLVASSVLAGEVLGWTPAKLELETIVRDAWNWHRAHPIGYG